MGSFFPTVLVRACGGLLCLGLAGASVHARDCDCAEAPLPVSLNEVMVALVNHSADAIWEADWRKPRSDAGWLELERMAYQLQLGGALLVIPGDGPMDRAWAGHPDWIAWSRQLEAAGERALEAVSARDVDAIRKSGDEIVAICEGCHVDFKPPLPSSGKFGAPSAKPWESGARQE